MVFKYYNCESFSAVIIGKMEKNTSMKNVIIITCEFLLLCLMNVHRVIGDDCSVRPQLKSEIALYDSTVQIIKQAVVDEKGSFKNLTWTELANFVDDFGSRLAGSQNLENAIDFLIRQFESYQFDNVHTENVSVPHWVRNEESCWLMKPRKAKLAILGLGNSVGTPEQGINAPVIVVESFEELKNISKGVLGKIVVFNQKYVSYGQTVAYRGQGATVASKLGAVAVLIRSITPFSIGSPHTGSQSYGKGVTPIPTACITVEHAEMLHRLYRRGKQLEISLKMGAEILPPVVSRNLIAEIQGREVAEKVVLVSGHIDSWDVGQGAMDDGGGAFISWLSLAVLKKLNLRPRRTIRVVLWTAEEEGYYGAKEYLRRHKEELPNFSLVMESDMGTFTPSGFIFHGSKAAYCILQEIIKLMDPFNTTILEASKYPVESDISLFQQYGVPGAGLRNTNKRYFWFHHSEGDSMVVEDPHALDLCTALLAAVSYIVADLCEELPRTVN